MVLVVFGIILLLVILALRSQGRHQAAATVAAAERREQRSREVRAQHLNPITAPFALAQGEIAYWSQPVTLQTLHANVEYIGESSSVSIRLARGIYAHSGTSRGRRVVSNAWGQDDKGIAYVTNQRFVFVGTTSSLEVKRLKVMGVDSYLDAVVLKRANAKAICLMTPDPEALSVILSRMLKDALALSLQDAVNALAPSVDEEHSTVGLKLGLKGTDELIRGSLRDFFSEISRTINRRKISFNGLSAMIATPPNSDQMTPATTIHGIFEEYRSAVAALAATTNRKANSPKEQMNTFVAGIGIFLDSLQEIDKHIRSAPFPRGYEKTRQALISMFEENVETIRSWPSIVEQSITKLGTSTSCDIDLSFDVNLAAVMRVLQDDAKRALVG